MQAIKQIVEKALKNLNYEVKNIEIIKSNRPDLCDYQYDGAFSISKIMHQNPYDIGCKIVEEIQKDPESEHLFAKIECLKPGFVNFTISNIYINETLNLMIKKDKFNITMPKKETIIIDYGGANVAKPLHVGHLRPAIVGESIKRILKYMNQNVIADVHLGDYGLQIGQVIYGLKKENIDIEDLDIKTLDRIYPLYSKQSKENEEIKQKCADITKQLQENNPEYQKYFQKILAISKQDIKDNYDYLDVSFDLWLGESDAYKIIPTLTQKLIDQNLLKESENALVIFVQEKTDKKELPPLIYQKSNKAYLYGTTDLATIYDRKQKYHPNKILYVADQRQSLHFTQVFRAAKKLKETQNIECEFLGIGTINGQDNKPYKTREGNTPKLKELFQETKETFKNQKEENLNISSNDLDIITNSIIKYADLQNNREKEYIFDSQKFSEVIGKTGPYILYTYLRNKKICQNHSLAVDNLNETIYNIHDRELRAKIIELDATMNYAFKTRLPSVIANYLYELCCILNTFYENNHINNLEDERKKQDWVTLISLTTNIIETLLNLLIIKIPTKM